MKYQNICYCSLRFVNTKHIKSLNECKQMPESFYNLKRKDAPPKIYTALLNKQDGLGDKLGKFVMKLQYDYDFSVKGLIHAYYKSRLKHIRSINTLNSEVIDALGVDLAVAHFVIKMKGKVKLCNSSQWIGAGSSNSVLPKHYVPDFFIEGIDLTGTWLMYEGLEYIPSLINLKTLILRDQAFLDDHCLRRIGRLRERLLYLDVSNCPQITSRGLSTLWSLRNLKTLVVEENALLEDKELVCLLLMDYLPEVQIKGIDFMEGLDPDSRDRIQHFLNESINENKQLHLSNTTKESEDIIEKESQIDRG